MSEYRVSDGLPLNYAVYGAGSEVATSTESDPTGRNPHEPGAKLDMGKAPVFRGAIGYFPLALKAVSLVSQHGASKYTWKGWTDVPDGVNRYTDALARHLVAEATGEVNDRDSGLAHAAHAAWNALARLELMLGGGSKGVG